MENEFEIVSHSQFQYLSVFLVHLLSRTPHIHRDFELGVVLEGTLTIQTEDQKWEIGKNALYLMNSMQSHAFTSDGVGALVLAIQISPKLFSFFLPNASMLRFQTEPPLGALRQQAPAAYEKLLHLCRALAVAYYAKTSNYALDCFRQTANLMYELNQVLPTTFLSEQEYLSMKNRTKRMVAILDYIDQNFQRKLLLEEIAEQQGLTMPHLSHLFRETLGISFQEYLKQKRFAYACMQLANTDRTILDISMDSGFSDVRYMSSIFKERLHCSPREYRNQLERNRTQKNYSTISLQYFLTDEEALEQLESWYEDGK